MRVGVVDLERWLAAQLRELTGATDDPRYDRSLRELGLTSLRSVILAGRLSEHLGREVPVTVLFRHPTLRELSAALTADEPRAVADAAHHVTADDPVAVVGLGCRFPGGASSPAALWELLCAGRDAIGDVPAGRWSSDTFDALDPATRATIRRGGFLDPREIDHFDPSFFAISPREAGELDPQQRLFLEVAWEALEDAGVRHGTLRGSATGVFVGAVWNDYARLGGGSAAFGPYTATGRTDPSVIAARLSFVLGLQGPSLTIGSACSSSLVAISMACESLRRGETTLAIAGGANLILAPDTSVAIARLGALSPRGHCHAFGADADGFVRGEGVGAVILKPLGRALADRDRVYAVIRGTAVNNDGASNGLTAPNPAAQVAVLRQAWARAQIAPSVVDYIEAHGTGTRLGDPIEAAALGEVFGPERAPDAPLCIGSLKSNLGHLEGAAGVAGLIKVSLALYHGAMPASLHAAELNPLVDFSAQRLAVQRAHGAWPASPVRAAGVSAFGWGGTNCHVALTEAPARHVSVLALAADTAPALAALVASARHELDGARDERALAARASALTLAAPGGLHRAAWVVDRGVELLDALVTAGAAEATPRPRVIFVCPGQGGQWAGMARSLLAAEPVFAEAIDRCDERVRALVGWSIRDELTSGNPERLTRTDVVQPLLFAFQVALAALWRSWGVEPDAIVGQSMGEVVAAHLAGVLSLDDACRVIVHGSRLAREVDGGGRGAMAVVEASPDEVAADAQGSGVIIELAGYMAPRTTIVAGTPLAIETLLAALEARGGWARRIDVDHASHSTHMEALVAPLTAALAAITARPSRLPTWSNVERGWLTAGSGDATYWARNLRHPMHVHESVRACLAVDPGAVFVELGPHAVTLETLAACGATVTIGSCWRDRDERRALLDAAAALHRHGVDIDWAAALHRDGSRAGAAELLLISARSETALRDQARRIAAALRGAPELRLADLAAALTHRRDVHGLRLACVATSSDEAAAAFERAAIGEAHPLVVRGRAPVEPGGVVFVFPGQGSQWAGMARELLDEPAFADTFDRCDAAIAAVTGWSARARLLADGDADAWPVDVVQPLLFAVSVSLAAVWRAWGVEPSAVIGHSQGELAAAYVAGALTLEQAARVVCVRSQLLRQVAGGGGGMVLVERGAEEVASRLPRDGALSIAAENGARSTLIAGEVGALDRALAAWSAEGVFCRRVRVDYASHSSQMDVLLPALVGELGALAAAPLVVPMISTVTGCALRGDELDAAYWASNLRQPVRFAAAMARLIEDGHRVFVEMSPHPLLTTAIDEALGRGEVAGLAVGSLRRGAGGRAELVRALATVVCSGPPIALRGLYPQDPDVALPTYSFDRQRYWLAPTPPVITRGRGEHPLLGRAWRSGLRPDDRTWEQTFSLVAQPYLTDHVVNGAAIVPAAVYVELALAAGRAAVGDGPLVVSEMTLEAALPLRADDAIAVQTATVPDGDGHRFLVSAADGREGWTTHARAVVRSLRAGELSGTRTDERAPPDNDLDVELAAALYTALAVQGLDYGPAFRGVNAVALAPDEAIGRVTLPETAGSDAEHLVHPALLDACLQLAFAAGGLDRLRPSVAAAIERVVLARPPRGPLTVRARVRGAASDGRASVIDATVWDTGDGPVLVVDGLRLAHRARIERSDDQIELAWTPAEAPRGSSAAGRWLVLADRGTVARAVATELEVAGAGVTVLAADEVAAPTALEAAVTAWATAGATRGVVHLAGLDADDTGDGLVGREGWEPALALVRALVALPSRHAPRVYVVTERAHALDDAPVRVSQRPLWGLAGTITAELPALRVTRVDLGGAADACALVRELVADDCEDMIGLRGDERRVARLRRAPVPEAIAGAAVRADATYVITGGLGGLGLAVGRRLAEAGAGRIVLLGRRGVTDDHQREAIAAMTAAGSDVVPAAVDVADREALARTLADAVPAGRPLRGVVHAAAVLADATVAQQTVARFAEVFAPKVNGAWHLHELTADAPLDFFVMCSSAATLLDLPGQGNYAAANAFLDGLAQWRRREGRPATSVALGVIGDVGLVTKRGDRGDRMAGLGFVAMSAAVAAARLVELATRPWTELGVIPLDVRRWAAVMADAAARPMWTELVAGAQAMPDAGDTAVIDRLRGAARDRRDALLEEAVGTQVAAVLRLDAAQIERDAPLASYGLDSLMTLELRNRLERMLGLRLEASVVFSYPSLRRLSSFLGGELFVTVAAPAAAARGARDELGELVALDPERLRAEISRELEEIEEMLA